MIRKIFYFIISSLLLFFSANIENELANERFCDKNKAIYMIRAYDSVESYSFMHTEKIDVLPQTIIKTGTPNTFVEIEPIVEKMYECAGNYLITHTHNYYTILSRYKTRILRI